MSLWPYDDCLLLAVTPCTSLDCRQRSPQTNCYLSAILRASPASPEERNFYSRRSENLVSNFSYKFLHANCVKFQQNQTYRFKCERKGSQFSFSPLGVKWWTLINYLVEFQWPNPNFIRLTYTVGEVKTDSGYFLLPFLVTVIHRCWAKAHMLYNFKAF